MKIPVWCPYFINSKCQHRYLDELNKTGSFEKGYQYQKEYCTFPEKWKECVAYLNNIKQDKK